MEDDRLSDKPDSNPSLNDFKALLLSREISSFVQEDAILNEKEKKRSLEWLKAASRKLRESFEKLTPLTGNESPNIRREVGKCCELWIRNCRISLEENINTFAEILLILSQDEDQSIAIYFTKVIEDLSRDQSTEFSVSNRDLIERHLGRMSRIIFRQSENEQLTALALLKAQLNCLPDQELILLFSSRKTLEIFSHNLLLFVEFNHDNPDLLKEEYTIRDYADKAHLTEAKKPWEDFKHFNSKSPKVINLIKEIMKSLGGRSATRILIDYLLDLLRDKPLNVGEIVKVLQLIGSSGCERDNVEIIEKLLDELLDEKYWNLSFQIVKNFNRGRRHEQLRVSEHTEGLYESSLLVKYVDSDSREPEEFIISPQEAKLNVLVTCVLMETIASLAHQVGADRFQKYLFRILYHLLANAGNSNFCIHSAGLLALTEITKVYKLTGVRDLVMRNSDYIMFFVNQSLRYPDRSNSALDVISVILEFCSKDVVGYVELIVHRLLEECAKYHKMDNLSAYLKIFGLFLKNMKKEETEEMITKEKTSNEILVEWLRILNPPLDDDIEIETDNEDPKEEQPPPEETTKIVPKEVEITKEILKVALKHISSKQQSEVLASMETLTWGIAVLQSNQDELLPVVHQIWTPLAKRFSDENAIILRNCFKMLLILSEAAKDFIHRRTVEEVVPVLNKILTSNVSLLAKSDESESR